jgi:putative ATPase
VLRGTDERSRWVLPGRAERPGRPGCPPVGALTAGGAASGASIPRDSLASVSLDDTDLFGAAASAGGGPGGGGASLPPLAVRMRPRSIDEVRGQGDVLRPGSPLRRLIEGSGGAAGPISAILWGPPGTGKTTLAHLVATAADREFVELSAVTAGVKDVRAVMEHANRARDMYGRQTVLFLDEIHRFTKAQQDALLPGVENRQVVLVAATTENPSFSVIAPLLSRSMLITLQPLTDDDVADVITSAITDPRGLDGEYSLDDDARDHLVRLAGGDARRALTFLEAAAGVAGDAVAPGAERPDAVPISLAQSEQAVAHAAVRYDRTGDQHYDVASALIKSMRGSDVDAALHYLARMLEAGEDPRFIARRVVIAASEDVGLADPTALQTAVAAMHAVAQIGMPEARIILAQAVVHNALAPKSNAAYTGINEAIADVRAGKGGPVPAHLRGSGYAGAARLGHGKGYVYAHDEPDAVAAQQYLPDDLAGTTDYYRPTDRGFEARLQERWTWLKGRLGRS